MNQPYRHPYTPNCEFSMPDPGPHPGCAEFDPDPGEITCDEPATRAITVRDAYEDPAHPFITFCCDFHHQIFNENYPYGMAEDIVADVPVHSTEGQVAVTAWLNSREANEKENY